MTSVLIGVGAILLFIFFVVIVESGPTASEYLDFDECIKPSEEGKLIEIACVNCNTKTSRYRERCVEHFQCSCGYITTSVDKYYQRR